MNREELEAILNCPEITDIQRANIEAVVKYGSNNKAAKALKRNRKTIDASVNRARATARQYYEPGFSTERKTIQVGAQGEIERIWYKTKANPEKANDSLVRALEEYSPKPFPIVKQPKAKPDSDYLDLLTITDFHVGMLAWSAECGDDWDIKVAEQTLANAIHDMIAKAKVRQNSKTAVLNIQGDFLHWDQLIAVTNQSGHILDADTRTAKMIAISMDAVDWAVLELLENYQKVIVVICEGNHDEVGSIWLRKHCLKMFAKNKRVEVLDIEFPYYALLHGEVMLCFHHGHKKKNPELQKVFSGEPRYRPMWGQANYAYIHTGHYPQQEKSVDELGGCIVERHPTLAAADAYAVRGGYISKRGAHVITYHKTHGEVDRSTVYPRS